MRSILSLLAFGLVGTAWGADSKGAGTIEGRVLDATTRAPIASAIVALLKSDQTATTDDRGEFRLIYVPVGSHSLSLTAPGFVTVQKGDVSVVPRHVTQLEVLLAPAAIRRTEDVTVASSFFARSDNAPSSVYNISAQEIRRAPGAYGDINRTVRMLPGIAMLNDQNNELIVRGGNPAETAFVLDNIEIPNPNHFPSLRSNGGIYSALNSTLIEDIDFYTGNYPSQFNDRLSSVLNLRVREGNRRAITGDLELGIGNTGGVVEGPLFGDRASFLLSYRHSYMGVLDSLGILNFDVVPKMDDALVKLVYKPSARHRLSLLGLWAKSRLKMDDDYQTEENASHQETLGLNWLFLWGSKGYSETTLSVYGMKNRNARTAGEEGAAVTTYDATLTETVVALRNLNTLSLGKASRLEFGLQLKNHSLEGDYPNGGRLPGDEVLSSSGAQVLSVENSSSRPAVFADVIWKAVPRVTLTTGLRADYSSFARQWRFAPRLLANYDLGRRLSLHAGFSRSYQSLPALLPLARWSDGAKGLPDPQSRHLGTGASFLATPSTRLSLELYDKRYSDLPVSPSAPDYLLIDRDAAESVPTPVSFDGAAHARGAEFLFQRKFTDKYFGLLSLTLATTRYRAYSEQWHDRAYDMRRILNVAAGWKPDASLEFGGRFTYASGRPYTPFDQAASQAANRPFYDETQVYGRRMPWYASLCLRVDQRTFYNRSSISFYLEVWNILNRQNVQEYYWSYRDRAPVAAHDIPAIPLLGIKWEF